MALDGPGLQGARAPWARGPVRDVVRTGSDGSRGANASREPFSVRVARELEQFRPPSLRCGRQAAMK